MQELAAAAHVVVQGAGQLNKRNMKTQEWHQWRCLDRSKQLNTCGAMLISSPARGLA